MVYIPPFILKLLFIYTYLFISNYLFVAYIYIQHRLPYTKCPFVKLLAPVALIHSHCPTA